MLFVEIPEEETIGNPRCKFEDNIKINFKEMWFEGVYWDLRDSGDWEVSGFCEHGNETSRPIKCGEFFSVAEGLSAYREELCLMQVRYF